jgi:DNA-binding transcriptional LysR family regulator
MDRLTALSAFVQAAETRSFSAAGRQLGISSSAIGKSIARLEDRVGVRLFHRTTRCVTLTADGSRFLERCQRIFGEMEAAELELAQALSAPSGRLKIGMPLIGLRLAEVINGFARAHPGIQLDLDYCDRTIDVIDEGFDIVMRLGDVVNSCLMTKSLGQYSYVIVAAPAYIAQHGKPLLPADLASHVCLHQRSALTGKPERWPMAGPIELPVTMVTSAAESLVDMALGGFGVACVPHFLVRQHIEARRLQPLLADHMDAPVPFRLLWPSNRHLSPKIKAFVDYISLYASRHELFALRPEPLMREAYAA